MPPGKSIRDIRARSDRPYNHTPVGPFYTEEERRRMRENIPHGVHPRVSAKGHMGTKSNYYVPTPPIPEDFVHPYTLVNFATKLIDSVPVNASLRERRGFWEKSLLDAYFHLYGDRWPHWLRIIPWTTPTQIRNLATRYSCEQPWSWMAKCRFIEAHEFQWSLDDLNYLIDRYPDRQQTGREQGIYVSDKPFEEIREVAEALNLPTREILDTLAEYARILNAG